MKERLRVLVLAAAALVLFYLLMFPKGTSASMAPLLPVSTEAGASGYLATWRWLTEAGVPVVSWRYRFDRLSDQLPSAHGNLLITSMPHRLPMRTQEWEPLQRWIERGNTLLILAGLDDTPPWEIGADSDLPGQLTRLTHLQFRSERSADLKQALQTLAAAHVELRPRAAHPLLAGVTRLRAYSDLPSYEFAATTADSAMLLELAVRTDTGRPVLWLKPQGAGQIILSAFASPFSNGQLAEADNARLLTNIIAWSRAPAGRVLFDDAHQDLAALFEAQQFFADPRLHRAMGWILLVWLAFVLGPQRLHAPRQPWRPVSETAYAEACGRYFSTVLDAAEAGRRLMGNFFASVNERARQVGVEPWDWLDRQTTVSAALRAELRKFYGRVHAGERVDLVRLQNLLSQLRRSLA